MARAGPTGHTAIAAVATAPSPAPAATTRCAGTMSERFNSAPHPAPATNPNCTAIVIQARADSVSDHAVVSDGRTADAENHRDMPRNSATHRSASAPPGREARRLTRSCPPVLLVTVLQR